jgi:acetyltransferase-like isoleucine patch superfamily enzyme
MRNEIKSTIGLEVNNQTVRIGNGATIEDGVILGYQPCRESDIVLIIGSGAHVRGGTVIYGGSRIGCNLETGHNVVIREENKIGDNFCIWNNSVIDYGCKIGNNVKVHNKVYVAQFTLIEDDVFLAPGVTLANDLHPGCPNSSQCMRGPYIKKGAQIGINCSILPRVTIGEYAVIGSGSVVTKDIPAGVIAYGNPARVVCAMEELTCTTGLRDKPYSHLIGRIEDAYTVR